MMFEYRSRQWHDAHTVHRRVMRLTLRSIACGLLPLLFVALQSDASIQDQAAQAQSPYIRSWDTRADLPHNCVNAIVQTQDGYLWLGTSDRLARFDGVRFKSFGLNDGLPSVNITALLEDHRGTLWIGTGGSGLCRLRQGQIETVANAEDLPGSDSINCLAEDGSGRLWVGTSGGLRVYQAGKPASLSGLGDLRRARILQVLASRDGLTLWIGSADYGLFTYRNGKLEPCIGPAGHEKILGETLHEDRKGRLWIGIGNGEMLCHENDQWQVYGASSGLPFAFVSSISEDADGTIWAGSLDAGLYRLDGTNFTCLSQKDGLSSDAIRSLLCDREGNLWIGTRTGGIDRLSRRKVVVVSGAQGLTNDYTHSVAQTRDGTIWVGTTGGSIYRGNQEKLEALRPADDERVYFYATVYPVLTAPDDSLWWGASSGLLHWQNNRLVDCISNETWVNAIVTALQNDPQGGMWIGTSAGRLVHRQNGQFTEFPHHVTRATITSLAVETNGGLWVGTTANGLKFIPTGSDTVQSVTNGLPPKASIGALYLDQSDTLWIGTTGGGLSCLRNGKITRFMAEQGLSAPTVLQIVEDDHQYLWLGCGRGIFRVSKAELLDYADGKTTFIHSRSFGLNDGMLAEECTGGYSPAGLKTKEGLICISTVKGLVFIDPNKVSDEAPPPKVMLEEAVIKGAEQAFTGDSAAGADPLSGLPTKPKLVIAPDRRDIELHYTAIGFSAPEKIGFRYKLEPLDTEWKEAGPLRTAPYTHLPPGNFTFHVQACNADGVWNDQDTTLAITAQPYFWETPSFHALVVLGIAGLVAGISGTVLRNRYKLRLARLQAQNAVERERLRISKDMHDHVGSVLTQVSQLTDMGVNETENESLVKKRFERIGNRARVAVQSLDEIVWATNPKNDNLASFAEYISRFSDEFFEYTNIRCWQEMPANVPALPLRADIRHNVFLALREALNNSVKHSHCTEVWLRMKIDQENVTVQFEDNGSGFTPGQNAPGADGLGNMESRLAECGGRILSVSAPGKGTSITFIFPIKH